MQVCACVYGGQRIFLGVFAFGQCACFGLHSLSLSWNAPSRLVWLASEPKKSTNLCLLRTGSINAHHQTWPVFSPFFKWVLDQTWVLMLTSKHFTPTEQSPQLKMLLLLLLVPPPSLYFSSLSFLSFPSSSSSACTSSNREHVSFGKS